MFKKHDSKLELSEDKGIGERKPYKLPKILMEMICLLSVGPPEAGD